MGCFMGFSPGEVATSPGSSRESQTGAHLGLLPNNRHGTTASTYSG